MAVFSCVCVYMCVCMSVCLCVMCVCVCVCVCVVGPCVVGVKSCTNRRCLCKPGYSDSNCCRCQKGYSKSINGTCEGTFLKLVACLVIKEMQWSRENDYWKFKLLVKEDGTWKQVFNSLLLETKEAKKII